MIEFNSFFRNSADPFVNGSMRSSNSEQFLSRVAEPEDFGLQNGLNDLSNVVSISLEKLFDLFLHYVKFESRKRILFLHDVENLDFKNFLLTSDCITGVGF